MSKRGSQRRRHLPAARQEETSVSVRRAVEVDRPGTVTIDSNRLEAPENQYDADYAWVVERNGTVSLFFAKGEIGRDALASLVEVRYPPEAFVNHFWATSRDFHQTAKRLFGGATGLAGRYRREHAQPERTVASRTHSLWANLDVIARHGTQASLDFYDVSPVAIAQFAKTKDRSRFAVNPVLRVNITVHEVLALLNQSEVLVASLEPIVRETAGVTGSSVDEGSANAE